MSKKKVEIPFWVWPILGTILIASSAYHLLTDEPQTYYLSSEDAIKLNATFVDINRERSNFINNSTWIPFGDCEPCYMSIITNLPRNDTYIIYGENSKKMSELFRTNGLKAYYIDLSEWISKGYPYATWDEGA
jgi:hypothetical protein